MGAVFRQFDAGWRGVHGGISLAPREFELLRSVYLHVTQKLLFKRGGFRVLFSAALLYQGADGVVQTHIFLGGGIVTLAGAHGVFCLQYLYESVGHIRAVGVGKQISLL